MATVTAPRWAKKRNGPSLLDVVFAGLRADQAKAEKVHKKAVKDGTVDEQVHRNPKKLHKSFPKAPPPLRSEPYRRLVASFPCINCTLEKHSQAAHEPPTAKGKKQSDDELFPLCTVGGNDCHGKFDGMKLHDTPQERRAQAKTWAKQTLQRALKTGKVPKAVLEYINPKKGTRR